jgi:hypothetical protein
MTGCALSWSDGPLQRITMWESIKQRPCGNRALSLLAEWTGLEPATPGVTGRYSNQLNYHSKTGPTDLQTDFQLVGAERLELPTYAL